MTARLLHGRDHTPVRPCREGSWQARVAAGDQPTSVSV
jgi:hypothetical protein